MRLCQVAPAEPSLPEEGQDGLIHQVDLYPLAQELLKESGRGVQELRRESGRGVQELLREGGDQGRML